MSSQWTRGLAVLSVLVVVVSGLATLVWALGTLGVRPLDGVEGDVLFESDRIRAGLPLYTDPAVGAHEYGAVPARFYVLYPPVWSWLLSLVPRESSLGVDRAAVVGRVVAFAAFLAPFVILARRGFREARRDVVVAAAFGGGMWTLALFGASARPDGVAVGCAGLGLVHAARRGKVDLLAGALFALAAWLKPNVIGAAPGAFLGCALVVGPRALARGLAGVAAVSAVVASTLTLTAGRAWVDHLLASTAQAPSLSLWIEQMGARGPFFVLPFGAALVLGWRHRHDAGAAIATGALLTSAAWSFLCLAKLGSASNYFIEPTIAAVVVLAHVPRPKLGAVALALVLVQVTWNGVATVRSSLERLAKDRARGDMLAHARERCGAPRDALVIADEPGIERMLNGRIVQTPFQSTHLAASGRFPIDRWLTDLASPEVACLVMQDDLLERASTQKEHDRFPPEVIAALHSGFVLIDSRADFRLYRRPP